MKNKIYLQEIYLHRYQHLMESIMFMALFFHVCHLAPTGCARSNAWLGICIHNPNIRWNNYFLKHHVSKGKTHNYLL